MSPPTTEEEELAAWLASEGCGRCGRSWEKVIAVVKGEAQCSMIRSMWCVARGLRPPPDDSA